MAYDVKGLRRQSHRGAVGSGEGSVSSAWAYDTNDAAAAVEAAAYFAAHAWAKGDTIDAVMARGGTPIRKGYVVTAVNAAGVPTVALQTTTAG
ncbi:MAG: hypothetical protein ACRCS9_13940 [Hyphomicrobium sp.]